MCHGELHRLRGVAVADQAGVADRVIGRAERPYGNERLAWLEVAHGAVDPCGLQALGWGHRWQDGGQALGQEGLAGARRSNHEDVKSALYTYDRLVKWVRTVPYSQYKLRRIRSIGTWIIDHTVIASPGM